MSTYEQNHSQILTAVESLTQTEQLNSNGNSNNTNFTAK